MIFVVSGEGRRDLGQCEKAQFVPGPMMRIIDKLLELILGYSVINTNACILVTENTLSRYCRKQVSASLPGKKKIKDVGYFFKNARGLAQIAQQKRIQFRCPVAGILFRDCDGTNSSSNALWKDKVDSMRNGFLVEDFEYGIPMIPKPKSEAWLLCALKNGYQGCTQLEKMSGNDNSPKSVKKELDQVLQNQNKEFDDIADMIANNQINVTRIKMLSYDTFRSCLEEVARLLNK